MKNKRVDMKKYIDEGEKLVPRKKRVSMKLDNIKEAREDHGTSPDVSRNPTPRGVRTTRVKKKTGKD